VGEEERGILFRLCAAIEVAVEQGEDAAGRLEELAAVSARSSRLAVRAAMALSL